MSISDERLTSIYQQVTKPLLDLLVSLILLVIWLPLILVILLILLFSIRKNPIFTQTRIGKNDKPFKLIKLRSYRIDNEYQSITRFGKFLRTTSLDELPQLVNIIKGDMSFVGPRPLLDSYLNHYTEEERKRHLVKPGLTGPAQIKWGNSDNWEERMRADISYVENVSFLYDFKLLLNTLATVLFNRARLGADKEIIKFDEFAQKR